MKNETIWNQYRINENYENEITKTDILIIGGGITGISCAYFLKDTNYKISLIDKSKITMGVTSKTTAKISYLQGTIYQDIEKIFNFNMAHKYLLSQLDAINIINNIIKKNNIECDLKKVDSILFAAKKNNIKKVFKEKELLRKMGIKTKTIKEKNYLIKVNDTYVFNPIKYLNEILKTIEKKIAISEYTTAMKIKKENNYYKINTNKGIIIAKIVIVACHYPFFIYPAFIPLKTYIKREYVTAAKYKNNNHDYSLINVDKNLHSIRFYKDYILYGSNNHKLTTKINYQKHYQNTKMEFYKNFKTEAEYIWMNQDIVSHDKLPFIGQIHQNLYIATAYNAWGMTNGTIAAKIITDLITNNKSKYQNLFDPKRVNIPLLINSFLGTFSYLKVYIETLFKKNNPNYIKIKNIVYGIYKDENKQNHYIKLICPHMKCLLTFNQQEKTWDCPCHGSRFDIDGNLIEGPAKKNLKAKTEKD